MSTNTAGLRRLPLPVTDPPYDDEIGGPPSPLEARRRLPENTAPIQGTLALSLATVTDPVPVAPPVTSPWLAEPAPATPAPSTAVSSSPAPSDPGADAGLPHPRRWCAKIAQALVETLYGRRPLPQLARWTSEDVYRILANRMAARPRAISTAAPSVRTIRICEVNSDVVEGCAVLQIGSRVRALALRLEANAGRWICTALELL